MSKPYFMFIVMLFLTTVVSGCSHSKANQHLSQDAIGEINEQALFSQYPAFRKSYDSYTPSEKELNAIASLKGHTVLVLFGSWCHDSEREVPRLLKTLELSGEDNIDVQLIAVNRNKRDPQGVAMFYELKYTPTFILLDGDKELGRVIEKPALTVAEDLQALLTTKQ